LYPKFRLFSLSKHFVIRACHDGGKKIFGWLKNEVYKVEVNTLEALIRGIRNAAAKKGMKQLKEQ
jgi:hypothetical protein